MKHFNHIAYSTPARHQAIRMNLLGKLSDASEAWNLLSEKKFLARGRKNCFRSHVRNSRCRSRMMNSSTFLCTRVERNSCVTICFLSANLRNSNSFIESRSNDVYSRERARQLIETVVDLRCTLCREWKMLNFRCSLSQRFQQFLPIVLKCFPCWFEELFSLSFALEVETVVSLLKQFSKL